MGCSGISKSQPKPLSSIMSIKLTQSLKKTQSLLSSSRNPSIIADKCLKLKIFPSNLKFLKSSLILPSTPLFIQSFQFTADYNYIKETYTVFISALRYFYDQVHEVCVYDYNIQDGICILLISIYANQAPELSFFESFPFFTLNSPVVTETLSMFKAWEGLIKVVETIATIKTEKLLKAQLKVQEFSKYLKKNINQYVRQREVAKGLKKTEYAIGIGEYVISETMKIRLQVQSFFSDRALRLNEISSFVEKAKKMRIFSGERIVHTILP